jgi:hypothetical protein
MTDITDGPNTACELCGNALGPHCADRLCRECDECAAKPGERCQPFCTAPHGHGSPQEHADA